MKIKEFALNIVLVFLFILMFFLMWINWSYSFSQEKRPHIFAMFSASSSTIQEQRNIKLKHPYKMAISKNLKINAEVYSLAEILEMYNFVYEDFSKALQVSSFKEVEEEMYLSTLDGDEFVYMQFYAPISAISEVESDIYASEIILKNTSGRIDIYIKSLDTYYFSKTDISYQNISLWDKYNDEYYFAKDLDTGAFETNLVSKNIISYPQIKIEQNFMTESIENEIIKDFLYNTFLVSSYESEGFKKVFVNEFSTVEISNEKVIFSSNDTRGNLFYKTPDLSKSQMISFAKNIFDSIYQKIGSEVASDVIDVYQEGLQTTVVLSGKINNIPLEYKDYAGFFVFSKTGLSYAEINVVKAVSENEKISPINSEFFAKNAPIGADIALQYGRDGKLSYVYKMHKE